MTATRWFNSFLTKHKFRVILGLILVTITSISEIVNPKISGVIVDDVIQGGNYELLPKLIVILIVVTLLRSVIKYCFVMMFETTSQEVLFNMREHVTKKLLRQDFSFYDRNRTGDLMSRQTGDMNAIRHFISFVIHSTYENLLFFIVALVMIFVVEWRLALCMVAVLPITIWIALKQRTMVKPAFSNIRERFSSLNTFVQENVSGNRVVKAFAKEDYEIAKFDAENDGYRDAELATAEIFKKYVPVFDFLASSLTVILYLVGGIMVINKQMTLGQLVQVSGFLWMLNMPMRQLGWRINDIQRFLTSVEKIHETVKQEPDITNPENAIVKDPIEGYIEFSNVNFSIANEEILNDISFKVKPGQTIGIVGATGSGKSTLMNLLCRFYDVSDGQIKVDGIDIRDMDLYALRKNIGMAMQEVFLFSDTIRENIAYGRTDASDEEVVEVSKIADAHDFIMEIAEDYDTIVGERGVGLSGGQKQRISLARALLKNPSIVILDDTTSAVDMETESQIQESLNSINKNYTVFIIAHRISSVIDADQILVLEEGKIIERGNHEELMENNGYYHKVFYQQYGDFDKIEEMKRDFKKTDKSPSNEKGGQDLG